MGSDPVLYLYRKNLQGDITGVYSGSTGTLLTSYVYDAWGKVTATDVANTTESAEVLTYNPYLYRGYRFDAETGLYYLNSRYYDPETGRFINADGFVSTGQGVLGSNMFAYCNNDPVNGYDSNGNIRQNICISFEGSACGAILCASLAFGATMLASQGQTVILPAISKSKAKKITTIAEASLARSKTKKYRSDKEKHHLVAKGATNAQRAKKILYDLDIDIDGDDNVLYIKTSLHRRLHTNLYYGIANSVVISAYKNAGNDKAAQEQAVLAALRDLKIFVKILDANPKFW